MLEVRSTIDDRTVVINPQYVTDSEYFSLLLSAEGNGFSAPYQANLPLIDYSCDQIELVNFDPSQLNIDQLIDSLSIHDFFQHNSALEATLLQLLDQWINGKVIDEPHLIGVISDYHHYHPVISARIVAYNLVKKFIHINSIIDDNRYWYQVKRTLHQYILVDDFFYMIRNHFIIDHNFNVVEFIDNHWDNELIRMTNINNLEYMGYLYAKRINQGDLTVVLELLDRSYRLSFSTLFIHLDIDTFGHDHIKTFLTLAMRLFDHSILDQIINGIVRRDDIDILIILNKIDHHSPLSKRLNESVQWYSIEVINAYHHQLHSCLRTILETTHNVSTYWSLIETHPDVINRNYDIMEAILSGRELGRIETRHFNWAIDNNRWDLIYLHLGNTRMMSRLPIMRVYDIDNRLGRYIAKLTSTFDIIDLNQVMLIDVDHVRWYQSIGGDDSWRQWISDRINNRTITPEGYQLLTGQMLVVNRTYQNLMAMSRHRLMIRRLMIDLLGESVYNRQRISLYGREQLSPQWDIEMNGADDDEVNGVISEIHDVVEIPFEWNDEMIQ